MAVQKFSELPSIARTGLQSDHKLVAVSEDGVFGRNLSINLQELRAPGLPAGYKLCAYVESNRDCYIDTGIPSSDKVGFQLTYQYMGPVEGDPSWSSNRPGEVIIGAGNSNPNNTRQWINDSSTLSSNPNKGYLCVGWGENETHGTGVKSTNDIIWGQVNFMMSNTAVVNNIPNATDIQLGYDAKFSGKTLYLFANNDEVNGIDLYTKARLYRCRISVGRQVKRDFIPVRRESDGKYGLFETVEKKVYFPEQGNLTGLELSSLWDYSHFDEVGLYGAYIDEYPTPNSPNFVKASGVEAGMIQIREALMVGPIAPNFTISDPGSISRFFAPFVENNTVGGNRNASAFLNVPNFNHTTSTSVQTQLTWLFINNTTWTSLGIRLPISTNNYYTRLGSSDCASCYITLDRIGYQFSWDYNCYIGFSNNNIICVTPQTLVPTFRVGTASNIQNSSLRYISNTIYNLRSYDGPFSSTNDAECKVYVYYRDNFSERDNVRIAYSPHVGKNSIYKFYAVHYKSLSNDASGDDKDVGAGALSAKTFTQPFNMESVVYRLKYLKRNYNTTTYVQGIDAQYFSIGEGQTRPTGTVTYSNFVLGKDGDKYTISVDATDGTNSCTYTLLDNDDPVYGNECRQLREALWNTNGVNGTSTGLLDGVVQVGPNIGQPYSAYCTLELRPVVHTWSD